MNVQFQTVYHLHDITVSELLLIKDSLNDRLEAYKATPDADPVIIAKFEAFIAKLRNNGSFTRVD